MNDPEQERAIRTRRKLLDAAIACLAESGYSGTTVTKIAQIAEVSRGAQLYHFPSKEDLLTEAVEHLAKRRFDELRSSAKLHTVENDGDIMAACADAVALFWSTFTGPLFLAAAELWQASRVDAALQGRVFLVEHSLGRLVHSLARDLFPAEVTASGDFDMRFATITYLMRGLALTRLLKIDSEEENRVLTLCTRLILPDCVPTDTIPEA